MTDKLPAIYPAMAAVMAEIEAIGKDSKNQTQNFMFRGIDAAYNAIHPLMAKHGIFTVPRVLDVISRDERTTQKGGILSFTLLRVEYDFVSGADGSKVTVGPIIGEGMDSGDKGCNKALAIAHKYALFQTFMIPTERSVDPDEESFVDVEPKKATAPKEDPFAMTEANPNGLGMEAEDEVGAAKMADLIIETAKSLQSDSITSLENFWNKNKKGLRDMKDNYPDQFMRVKYAFDVLKAKLQAKPQGEGND